MTTEMTPEKAAELRKKFPPNTIGKIPKGGVMLPYVGHAAVSDRLLTVDPAWTWEPLALDDHGLPALDTKGNLWIKLTVCGVTRLGVGDGKNAKEVIGDAIRNAAMRFGVALDLWSKDELESAGDHTPEPTVGLPPNQAPVSPPFIAPKLEAAGHTAPDLAGMFKAAEGIAPEELKSYISGVIGHDFSASAELTHDEVEAVKQALAWPETATPGDAQ